uniref:Uncharacterized protein n=1 Tax=Anguilla anguilla TaxID=7936 RepID=A0A0E9QPC7_ANGAN
MFSVNTNTKRVR